MTVRCSTNRLLRKGVITIYTYMLPRYNKLASQMMVTVFDGSKETKVTLKRAGMQVQGQTSGEWVLIGRYKLKAGANTHVTIQAAGADGAVVADAVLLVPETK
jgi:hypothetical protein